MQDLGTAYQRYLEVVADLTRTRRWGAYADLFTEDAVVRRTGAPDVVGREAIRAMMATDTTTLPGSLIERTEVLWHVCDRSRGLVVQEMRHVATDPGDGSLHVALATSLLHHDGEGLWSGMEVQHSPHAYRAMYRGWARAAAACGRVRTADEVTALLAEAHPVV